MRNTSDNVIDNMRNRLFTKIQGRINSAVENSEGNALRNSKDNRDGLHNWGALQMFNYHSNDFATFGVGFTGTTVGV